ncbi:MAG: hypothetical protein HY284_01505 [Nitrospirae bacterium]|nr:hypothetical protein [Nitrospirota bacterium]
MGTKLYVGGLPYSTTEQQLSELFAPALNGTQLDGRTMTVNEAKPQEKRAGGGGGGGYGGGGGGDRGGAGRRW